MRLMLPYNFQNTKQHWKIYEMAYKCFCINDLVSYKWFHINGFFCKKHNYFYIEERQKSNPDL